MLSIRVRGPSYAFSALQVWLFRAPQHCHLEHAPYPSGFTASDKAIMEKYIQDTKGLSEYKDKKLLAVAPFHLFDLPCNKSKFVLKENK